MSRIDQLLDDLRNEAARKRLSQKHLALLAGIHPNTMLHFRDPRNWSPSVATIRALEEALFPTRKTVNIQDGVHLHSS